MRRRIIIVLITLLGAMIAEFADARESADLYALWSRARKAVREGRDLAALDELSAACGPASRQDGTDAVFAAECHRWVGEQQLALGQLDRAAESLSSAHAQYSARFGALNPLSGEILYLLARLHMERGDHVRAAHTMECALAIVPPLDASETELCRAVYAATNSGAAPEVCKRRLPDLPPSSESPREDEAAKFGMFALRDMRRYRGFHVHGIRSGYGLEIGAHEWEFWRGVYHEGSLNGHAVWLSAGGDSAGSYYSGGWKSGLHHGYGTFRYANGTRHTGTYRNGAIEGVGELLWTSGARYKGAFASGDFSGEGTLVVPGFLHFVGTWKAGRRSGYGVEEFAEGTITYRGEYVDDKPRGDGNLLVDGRKVFSGDSNPDVGIGFGIVNFPEGDTYVGQLRDGVPHGFGLKKAFGGSITTGIWADSRRVRAWTNRDFELARESSSGSR